MIIKKVSEIKIRRTRGKMVKCFMDCNFFFKDVRSAQTRAGWLPPPEKPTKLPTITIG